MFWADDGSAWVSFTGEPDISGGGGADGGTCLGRPGVRNLNGHTYNLHTEGLTCMGACVSVGEGSDPRVRGESWLRSCTGDTLSLLSSSHEEFSPGAFEKCVSGKEYQKERMKLWFTKSAPELI